MLQFGFSVNLFILYTYQGNILAWAWLTAARAQHPLLQQVKVDDWLRQCHGD